MKRLVGLAATLCLILAVCVIAETVISDVNTTTKTYKNYFSSMPGQLYFIMATNVSGLAWSQTNYETEAWYPAKIEIVQDAGAPTSTNILAFAYAIKTEWFLDSQIVTNAFGIVATNQLHALTNTTTEYICNTVWTFTNTSTNALSCVLDQQFVQKYDVLRWTFSSTNGRWVRIIGRR